MAIGDTIRVARQARDQLGHWVAPPSADGRPCPHACCQGKRRHPKNMPVKLSRSYLRGLSEDELVKELESYSRYSETHEEGFLQIIAEDTRRVDAREKAVARREKAVENRRRRSEEHRDEVYRQWLQAEAITNGNMLNKAGRKAGIDERTLFTGPESRVEKYASRELLDFFEANPRPTRETFLGSSRQRREALSRRRIG
jgi:hypothetical protein